MTEMQGVLTQRCRRTAKGRKPSHTEKGWSGRASCRRPPGPRTTVSLCPESTGRRLEKGVACARGQPHLTGDVVHQKGGIGAPEVEVADTVVLLLAGRVPDLQLHRRSAQLHHLGEERTWNTEAAQVACPSPTPGLGCRAPWAQHTRRGRSFPPPTAGEAEQHVSWKVVVSIKSQVSPVMCDRPSVRHAEALSGKRNSQGPNSNSGLCLPRRRHFQTAVC